MAARARGMIDLAESSSDEDETRRCSTDPELNSSAPARPSRAACQRSHNRKRAAAGFESVEEIVNVSSSPSLSPVKMDTKTKKEKKQEALNRARAWRDNLKIKSNRGTPGRGSTNAAVGSREVINLTSPSSPTPGRNNGRRSSRNVARARTPPPKKMTKIEKQEARARARQWHDNRPDHRKKRSSDYNLEESFSEEVGSLSSPSSIDSVDGNNLRSHFHQSNQAVSMGESQQSGRMAELPQQQYRPREAISFAASSLGRRNLQREEETQQWSCPTCTLLNPQNQSRCSACYHENSEQRNNHWSGEGDQVYDVDSDGDFILESEQGPSASGATHGHVHGGRGGSVMFSDVGRGTSSEVVTREILQRALATSAGEGWGRPRAFTSTLFGGRPNHHPMAGHSASGNSAFLSQFFQSMGDHQSNGFGQFHISGDNVDNMSYERLLEVFGDGSENRGASSEAISSLPVSRIGDPKELPDGKRQCSICLEDFCRGDERTSLPCLHGFHSSCVSRWLSSNGTCPVCKTSVSGSR